MDTLNMGKVSLMMSRDISLLIFFMSTHSTQTSIATGPIILYVSAFIASVATKFINKYIGLKVSERTS